jgi:allantoinase
MPAERRRGMDQDHYVYSALPARPALAWLGGAALASWICLHLEYWELDPPKDSRRIPGIDGMWQIYFPDYRTQAHREYGNRIGFFRVRDALRDADLKATVSVNAEVCRRYPHLVEACLHEGWEIAAGGTHATRMLHAGMSEAQEVDYIEECAAAVRAFTGKTPAGWIGQDFNETARTPALLARHGFQYLADWPNDEQPYWMNPPRPIVSVPQQTEWDDVTLLWMRQILTQRFPEIVIAAFEQLRADGARFPRSFVLNIHTWLLGQPHRIRYLREILQHMADASNVWHTSASAIAGHFASVQAAHFQETR